MEFFFNFSWAVPQAFSDAVALCRFEEGDVLYDTPKAYDGSWGEAVKHITHSLQVRYPARATSSEKEKVGTVFEKNWNSEVRIELYKNQEKVGVGQITTTQGRLYTAIWKGDLTVLETDTEDPPLPINVKNRPYWKLKPILKTCQYVCKRQWLRKLCNPQASSMTVSS